MPPIYYVTLAPPEEPAPPALVPEEEAPPKQVESEVKIAPEKKKEAAPAKPTPKKQEPPKNPQPKKTEAQETPAQDVEIQTDQPSFEFNYYLATVRSKISSRWRPPAQGFIGTDEKAVVVHFRILRDGSVLKPTIEKSSGIDLLDQSALRAVLDAAPLPPLPDLYDNPWLGIHLRFVPK